MNNSGGYRFSDPPYYLLQIMKDLGIQAPASLLIALSTAGDATKINAFCEKFKILTEESKKAL